MSEVRRLKCHSSLLDLAIRGQLCYIRMIRTASVEASGQSTFHRREPMFDVTQKATEMIKESLKEQEKNSPIRVIYNEGG